MQTGMFKEVIDTIISEINVSTNMFFWKQQLKTTKWYTKFILTCWWYTI